MKNKALALSPLLLLMISLFTHPLLFSLTYYFFEQHTLILIGVASVLLINIMLLAYLALNQLIRLKRKQQQSALLLISPLTIVQTLIQLALIFYSYVLAEKDDAPGLILIFTVCFIISLSHYYLVRKLSQY
ncbi:hypothetical protein ACWN8B_07535 [Vagococcus zengguangii]